MIPEKLVDFLKSPVVINFATRNADLQSTFSRTVGVIVSENREDMTFFIHESFAKTMLANLNDNGRIAILAGSFPSHECYQFKGSYISSRNIKNTEIEFQEKYRKILCDYYSPLGLPENFFLNMPSSPGLAVTFSVEDIFVQTPGPGAGKKIDFS